VALCRRHVPMGDGVEAWGCRPGLASIHLCWWLETSSIVYWFYVTCVRVKWCQLDDYACSTGVDINSVRYTANARHSSSTFVWRLPAIALRLSLSFTHFQIALDSGLFNSSSPGLCLMRVVYRLAIRVVCFRTYRWRISWVRSSAAGKVLILISLTLKFDQAITNFNTKKHCKRTTPSRLILSFRVETLAIACLRRSSATSCARPWSWMLPRAAAWFHLDQELRAAD